MKKNRIRIKRLVIWTVACCFSLCLSVSTLAFQTTSPFTGTTYSHTRSQAGQTVVNGIDVSAYQDSIDWGSVKNAGVDFAMIRLGYRGSQAGTIQMDSYYRTNISGAAAAGIKTGVYFFTQAVSEEEARQEAQYCIQNMAGYTVNMPVAIDFESVSGGGRMYDAGLSQAQYTAIVSAFCDTIKKAGYTPAVYTSISVLSGKLNGAELSKKYKLWVAHYASETYLGYPYDMWQYSSSGQISGINGRVDCNFYYPEEWKEETANPGAPYAIPSGVFQNGSSGDGVRWIQKALNTVCGKNLDVDGEFGNNTKNAVTEFQQSQGLTVDGIVGSQTIQKLVEVYKSQHPSDAEPPVISNVTVSGKTSSGYTVSCTVTDNVGVTEVKFPTWRVRKTSAGCTWYPGTRQGNTWSFTYSGAIYDDDYLTHIYAYDAAGNQRSSSAGTVSCRRPWKLLDQEEGTVYEIESAQDAGYVLDVANGSKEDGGNIQLYTRNGTDSQRFLFEPVGDGWYRIRNIGSSKVLDVYAANPDAEANLDQYGENGTQAQLFRLADAGNGYCYVISALGTYIDNANGIVKSGNNIQMYPSMATMSTKMWKLKVVSVPKPTATVKPTQTPTKTPKPTATAKPTTTVKPTQTPGTSATAKPTQSPTQTPGSTATAKPTQSPTQTPGSTVTAKPTQSPTQTPGSTVTAKPTEMVISTGEPMPTKTPEYTKLPSGSSIASPSFKPDEKDASQNSSQQISTKYDGEEEDVFFVDKACIKRLVACKGRKLKIKIYRQSYVQGYQIAYSTNRNMRHKKKRVTSGTSIVLNGLKKKRYYVRVRAIARNGEYGAWSARRSIRIRR